ncbi:MAG: hypothetical protein ABIK83_14140 [Candidatus Zixiibacteriota bacterium]
MNCSCARTPQVELAGGWRTEFFALSFPVVLRVEGSVAPRINAGSAQRTRLPSPAELASAAPPEGGGIPDVSGRFCLLCPRSVVRQHCMFSIDLLPAEQRDIQVLLGAPLGTGDVSKTFSGGVSVIHPVAVK